MNVECTVPRLETIAKAAHQSEILAATLLVLSFPLCSASARADEAEDRAVTFVETLGGRIVRDDETEGKPIISVDLPRASRTDAVLEQLSGLKRLKWLDLNDAQVTDAGLKYLTAFPELETLYLSDTSINGTGLTELTPLSHLKTLCVGSANLNDDGLTALGTLKQLQKLYLNEACATDAGISRLAGLEQLQELHIAIDQLSDAMLERLPAFKKLTRLALDYGKVTDAGLEWVAKQMQLKWLSLHDTNVTGLGLGHLAGLVHLERLDLAQTKVTDAGLESLRAFHELRELNLEHTKVTGVGLKGLHELHQLHTLRLACSDVSDDGLIAIGALKQIHDLDLGNTKVTDIGVEQLLGLSELEWLSIAGCGAITDKGLSQLAGLEKLQFLRLYGVRRLTCDGVDKLQEELPKCKIEVSKDALIRAASHRRLRQIQDSKAIELARCTGTSWYIFGGAGLALALMTVPLAIYWRRKWCWRALAGANQRVTPLIRGTAVIGVAFGLFGAFALLWIRAQQHDEMCDQAMKVHEDMPREEVLQLLGEPPGTRGDWPKPFDSIGTLEPQSYDRWEDGQSWVVVRYDAETTTVVCKEVAYIPPKPSPARHFLEWLGVVKPRVCWYHAGS